MQDKELDIEILSIFLKDIIHKNDIPHLITKTDKFIYDDILVGYQKADHPIFYKLQEIIPDHLHPLDFNSIITFKSIPLSVITIALMINKEAVSTNSQESIYPSYQWYEANMRYEDGVEYLIEKIRFFFNSYGFNVFYPEYDSTYKIFQKSKKRFSNWSKRHIAYACGMGSFGLHGALITEQGCCHKLFTFITDFRFDNYSEPQESPFQNCLYYHNKKCRKCIQRCPVNSLSEKGHNIQLCIQHEHIDCSKKAVDIIGKEFPACGLCMTGVPCSFTNPVKNI